MTILQEKMPSKQHKIAQVLSVDYIVKQEVKLVKGFL